MNPSTTEYVFLGFYILTLIALWSFFEWWFHSQPMHKKSYKKVPYFRRLTASHTGHHDHCNYCPKHGQCHILAHKQAKLHAPIRQELSVGILIVLGSILAFVLFDWLTGWKFKLCIVASVATYAYYWVYELMHYAAHDGLGWQRALIKKTGFFASTLKHHMGHHVDKLDKNYTLVNRLMDYVFDTKLGASKGSILAARSATFAVLTGFLVSFGFVAYQHYDEHHKGQQSSQMAEK